MSEELSLEDLEHITVCLDFYRCRSTMDNYSTTVYAVLSKKVAKAIDMERKRRRALEKYVEEIRLW